MWRNTCDSYGRLSIGLHWLIAFAVPALFGLGLWMVGLDYYHAWYQRAPDWHRSAGVLLLGVALLQLAWRLGNPHPRAPGARWQARVAAGVHGLLQLLLFATLISGYLISTADGRAIDVFDLFSLPATVSGLPNQADMAGKLHRLLAYGLIGLASAHALAALKHHFIDHDTTLLRMLGSRRAAGS